MSDEQNMLILNFLDRNTIKIIVFIMSDEQHAHFKLATEEPDK